jgi:Helix-turn-helix domain
MATNERLRGSLATAQLKATDVAERLGVDPKTVERWITRGRLPHRSHRVAVAQALQVDEAYLWPEVLHAPATQSASVAELLELHPSRAAVPHDVWQQLIGSTHEAMDVLTYAGTFLFEQHDICTVMRNKAAQGVRCRFLIGDETSKAVKRRAIEEGTPGGLQGRIQVYRRSLRDVVGLSGVEVRTHSTTLYNSLFRFDQDLMVNPQAYGEPAGHSPVLHLRRVPGGRIWDHYMRSFEAVWDAATPES